MPADFTTILQIPSADYCLDTAASWERLLAAWGYEVGIAHTGSAAFLRVEQRQPDVILLDIGLPGMNGWEVARRLRGMHGLDRALLIAVSGYGREEDHRRSREAGCDLHLCKPVALHMVQRLLDLHQQRKTSQCHPNSSSIC